MSGGPVLVVDDYDAMREAVMSLLGSEGIEVLTAADGMGALEVLRSRPDVRLVVLDVVMPVMDGVEFRCAQLEDPLIAHVPVVLVTGHHDFRRIGVTLRAAASLQKPVSAEDLVGALARFLEPTIR